jgi:hypothetical protein
MTPDQQEHLNMARRSQMRLAQGFQIYCFFLVHDKTPAQAIEAVEDALSAWIEYADKNEVLMPEVPSETAGLVDQLKEMFASAQKLQIEKAEQELQDDGFLTPDQLGHHEQTAWERFQEIKALVDDLRARYPQPDGSGIAKTEHAVTLDRELQQAEHHWRGFGTAHLRRQLGQLPPELERAI